MLKGEGNIFNGTEGKWNGRKNVSDRPQQIRFVLTSTKFKTS